MRTPSSDAIGIHLLLIPSAASGRIPHGVSDVLARTAQDIALITGCIFKAIAVRDDHMHILLQSTQDDSVGAFIEAYIERALQSIHDHSSRARSFAFDDRIHITLLPPWHIDLFTAFIRDQDHYHETHTLQQELADIFVRGAANIDEGARQDILDSVAHVGVGVN